MTFEEAMTVLPGDKIYILGTGGVLDKAPNPLSYSNFGLFTYYTVSDFQGNCFKVKDVKIQPFIHYNWCRKLSPVFEEVLKIIMESKKK